MGISTIILAFTLLCSGILASQPINYKDAKISPFKRSWKDFPKDFEKSLDDFLSDGGNYFNFKYRVRPRLLQTFVPEICCINDLDFLQTAQLH